jgi:hypothetical protein
MVHHSMLWAYYMLLVFLPTSQAQFFDGSNFFALNSNRSAGAGLVLNLLPNGSSLRDQLVSAAMQVVDQMVGLQQQPFMMLA